MRRIALFLFVTGLFLSPSYAKSDDVYQVIIKRQEAKKASRWSLAEWFETRNRIRLMDMWLALHTPTPFEFYLGGDLKFGQLDHDRSFQGGSAQFAAFATIFGLGFEREQSAAKLTNLLFHLRLFGFHNQTTNLTLHGGLRFRGQENEFRSPFAGATLTFYFSRYFGVDGGYRHIFKSSNNDQGFKIGGSRFEGNAFIEFNFLRVFGGYFQEQETATDSARQNAFPVRSGAQAGIKLFF